MEEEMQEIAFRAVVEVLGKPQQHVESSLKNYVNKLKEDENYTILREEFANAKQQEDQDLWAVFAELEIKTSSVEKIIMFCFEYMPSVLEIITPKNLSLESEQITVFLNELQAKLHQVDMVAKQLKIENNHLGRNMGFLLKNYVAVILSTSNLDAEQLSKLTGVHKDALEDFLDQLIDEGKIDMKEGIYFASEKPLENHKNA